MDATANTKRRLTEMDCIRGYEPRTCRVMRARYPTTPQLSKTLREILDKWQPLDLGYYSNALVYSPALCRLPIAQHVAIVRLIALGYLEAIITWDGTANHEILRKTEKARPLDCIQRQSNSAGIGCNYLVYVGGKCVSSHNTYPSAAFAIAEHVSTWQEWNRELQQWEKIDCERED